MTKGEAVNWIINIAADIGKIEHQDLWHYEQALSEIREMLESEHDVPETNVGDTIYRQAAIDAALTKLTVKERSCHIQIWSTVAVKYWVVNLLEQLPSAQPEIIRCKDCKHRHEAECPMYHEEDIEWDDDGYIERETIYHDWTEDDGYCDRGEGRTDAEIH